MLTWLAKLTGNRIDGVSIGLFLICVINLSRTTRSNIANWKSLEFGDKMNYIGTWIMLAIAVLMLVFP